MFHFIFPIIFHKKYPPFGFTKGEYCAIIILYPLWCLELSFLFGRRELSSLFIVLILIY
nr:MAG TPA: hypothetical protein [Herelleviridae sp.]